MALSTYCDNPMGHDPRPELIEDHERWEVLLLIAERSCVGDRTLVNIMHVLRCLGAGLVKDDKGLRIVPGEIETAEYGALKAKWLVPHLGEIKDVLILTKQRLEGVGKGCPICAGQMKQRPNAMHVCERCGIADLRRGA